MSRMMSRPWYTLHNRRVYDIRGEIQEALEGSDKKILIGTDSQRFDQRLDFVTAIVILKESKGGIAFYTREKDPKFNSLREKLMKEAWNSLETAFELEPVIPQEHWRNLTIHIDANPNPLYKSSSYVKELVGLIAGQGFNTVIKPDAWAASHVAEHIVKNKHLRLVA